MKCPKCRKEMAFDATTHPCGWRVGASVAQNAEAEPGDPPATAAAIEAHLEKMRAVLNVPRRERLPDPGVKKLADVPMMRDVGHGSVCTCALCWAQRMTKTFGPVEVIVAPPADTPEVREEGGAAPSAIVDPADREQQSGESRQEYLQRMFPLDG